MKESRRINRILKSMKTPVATVIRQVAYAAMIMVMFLFMFIAATSTHSGGRYPLYLTKIHGDVQIRADEPGSRWKPAKLGALDGGPSLLRTGERSYVHLGKFRCLDSGSLIRINRDSEASIDVL